MNEGKPYDLRDRTLLFARDVLLIVEKLSHVPNSAGIREQIARCSTSVGANTEEADGAETAADKRKSLVTARKEAAETRFWLRLIRLMWGKAVPVEAEIQEAHELTLILSTRIRNLARQIRQAS